MNPSAGPDRRLVLSLALLLAAGAAHAQQPSPHAIDIPRWFSLSLLDFKDEIPEAARAGKRVMVYFGQDGCPYCKALMQVNFAPGPIATRVQQHFVSIAINIWGDSEVTWIDGRRFTEKTLARELKVQFTPTLLFFDTDGRQALRVNGYHAPERFGPMLDYVIERQDRQQSLAEYLDGRHREPALAPKGPRPYLNTAPTQLARAARRKPLAVLFESPSCKTCAELHDLAFARPSMRQLLQRFDVASLKPGPAAPLTTPDGRRSDTRAFARDLQVSLYPTVVFFDDSGREAFRFDGYLRPFHVESAFEYVASGGWKTEPQFQRYVQARAERLQAAGQKVDLWN
ncbi:MAG: thioredoxin fold domain-containing protein [Rubrivivax sp.]